MKEVTIDGKTFVERQEDSDMVLVRTYSAGVHFGELKSRDGKEVVLTNARRLWSWRGACSLSQVAIDGVAEESKISVAVPEITLTEAIEIIPMSRNASDSMIRIKTWKR
jgi:hypothetical protein